MRRVALCVGNILSVWTDAIDILIFVSSNWSVKNQDHEERWEVEVELHHAKKYQNWWSLVGESKGLEDESSLWDDTVI